MKKIDDIVFNEQWDRVLEEISKDKNLIGRLELYDLAWKRFQYQLAVNGKEELIAPFGDLKDLLIIIDKCKDEGIVGLTIPQATAFQQLDQIKKLLKQGHNIDEQDFEERTGLLVAATLNDEQLVQFFIDNGAFVTFFDQNKFEAIDLTTSNEIIELLARHGGKTKAQRRQDYNEYCVAREKLNIQREINLSFMKAAEKGDLIQMLDALKESSMEFITLNFAYPINGWTALHYAAKNNDKKTFDFLVSKGIDTKKKNIDGLTAKELAKLLGHNEI
jgi:ankyrin repeat protein